MFKIKITGQNYNSSGSYNKSLTVTRQKPYPHVYVQIDPNLLGMPFSGGFYDEIRMGWDDDCLVALVKFLDGRLLLREDLDLIFQKYFDEGFQLSSLLELDLAKSLEERLPWGSAIAKVISKESSAGIGFKEDLTAMIGKWALSGRGLDDSFSKIVDFSRTFEPAHGWQLSQTFTAEKPLATSQGLQAELSKTLAKAFEAGISFGVQMVTFKSTYLNTIESKNTFQTSLQGLMQNYASGDYFQEHYTGTTF